MTQAGAPEAPRPPDAEVRRGTLASRYFTPGNCVAAYVVIFTIALIGGIGSARAQTHVPSIAPDAPVRFDPRILDSRGLGAQIGEYFGRSARFRPGSSQVDLYVNEVSMGRKTARFDSEGRLCFDVEFILAAGLARPPEDIGPREGDCYDYRAFVPRTLVQADVGLTRIDIVVPQDQITKTVRLPSIKGGRAAMLNYRLDTLQSRGGVSDTNSGYSQLSTEFGFNRDDWIFRSRQIASIIQPSLGETLRTRSNVYSYVQKSFPASESLLQAGQISTQGFLYGGVPISGAQWTPEQALTTRRGTDGLNFSGIAQTQARVEIYQSGLLIYSTVVPPGPFNLSDVVPLRRASADLQLRVTESDGRQSQYFVSGATALANSIAPQGLTVAVGQVRGYEDLAGDKPTIFTAERGFELAPGVPTSAGAAFADRYAAVAGDVDLLAADKVRVHLLGDVARDGSRGQTGARTTATASFEVAGNSTLALTARNQSFGFLPLAQVGLDDAARAIAGQYRSQYSISVSGAKLLGGSVAMSASLNRTFREAQSSSVALSWGRTFDWGSLNLTYQYRKLDIPASAWSETTPRNMVYVAFSIPIGDRHTVTAYTRRQGNLVNTGVNASAAINDAVSYNLNADHTSGNEQPNFGGSVSFVPKYTSMTLAYNQGSSAISTYSLSSSGGVIAADGAVVFSPYEVADTFGVIKVGELSGVKVDTPRGPVWTDSWGRAAIAALPPYSEGRVELAGETLPRNIDVSNALHSLHAGRGAVATAHFNVVAVRRILLTVTLPDGRLLPGGSAIAFRDERFLTTSADGGVVFLPDAVGELDASLPSGETCALRFTMPKQSSDRLYETAAASCVPDVSNQNRLP